MAENKEREAINFYKPKKRFIIPIDKFHIPKKLFLEFKKNKFKFLINSQFANVIEQCSLPREKDGEETWINNIIKETYIKLNSEGIAKSIECYYENKLVAGLYGLLIGACFFGESMFNNKKNTSKLCLLVLISILKENNFELLDSQFYNKHLIQFGAFEITDKSYDDILKKNINKHRIFPDFYNYENSLETLQSISQRS